MKTFTGICMVSVAAIGLICFSGCKKGSTTVNCKITKVQNTLSDTMQITYDNLGQVSTIGSPHYWGAHTFTYNGLTASCTIQVMDTGYHYTNNLSLDVNGRLISMYKSLTRPGYAGSTNYTLQYNAEGYITYCTTVEQTAGSPTIVTYIDSLFYTNGNLTEKYTYQKVNSAAPTVYQHVKVEYGTALNKVGYHAFYGYEPPLSVDISYTNYAHLMGNTSKNLPVTTKYYDSTNSLYQQIDFTYVQDENGYPTDMNMVRTINYSGIKNRKFEYSCN